MMAAHHSTPSSVTVKEEGLSIRVIAVIVLFFVIGVTVGKLLL